MNGELVFRQSCIFVKKFGFFISRINFQGYKSQGDCTNSIATGRGGDCTNPTGGGGGGVTRIGNDNLLLPYVHVAHDCQIGNNIVLANNVGITGHVEVADWVILGGYVGVNQFLKIGAHAMVGGMAHITNDIPAYMILSGNPAKIRGVNVIGLERRGFDKATIAAIREAFKILYKRNLKLREAIEKIRAISSGGEALGVLIDSLEASEKGIHR